MSQAETFLVVFAIICMLGYLAYVLFEEAGVFGIMFGIMFIALSYLVGYVVGYLND